MAAKRLLQMESPADFCASLRKLVKGAGCLGALKVAWLLQTNGRLPKDDAPELGETESAFCAARAAIMDELLKQEGPLWLKAAPKGKGRARGKTLKEQNYVEVTQAQVQAVIRAIQDVWVEEAQRWWDSVRAADTDLADRYQTAIERLLLQRPTVLQVESLLCEVASRGLRARHVAECRARGDKSEKGAKGSWAMRDSYTRKDLARIAIAFASATRGAVRHEAVER